MSSTQTEYVQGASLTNIETDNGASVQIASSDGQQICLTESNTPTTDNKKNLKRSHLPIDISGIPPSKKFCFIDGVQTTHISREDFISDDAWIRFLKFTVFKNRQVEASNKNSHRKGKIIKNIKELIERDVEQVELEGCPNVAEVLQEDELQQNAEENVEPPRKKRIRRGGRICFVCCKRSKVQKLRPCGHRVCMLCIPGLKDNACPSCGVDIDSYLPPELMPKKNDKGT